MNHVYVLDFGDRLEIGSATDVPRCIHEIVSIHAPTQGATPTISAIENASGQKPTRHFSIKADPIYETLLRERLSEHRGVGEYFTYPYEEAVALLQRLIAEARVVLDHRAAKYLERMSEPNKSRIKDAIAGLSNEPSTGDIKKLADRDDYRLRVGGYRIIYRVENDTIIVSTIAPRGQAYKE